MAYAVTHVILTIVLIDLYRDYIARKKFPTKYVLLGGIAGLLPDIDIPFGWIYNFLTGSQADFHGSLTHWSLIPMLLAIAALLSYEVLRKPKLGLAFAVTSFGCFFHLILDCMFSPCMIFHPFSPIACPAFFDSSPGVVAGLDAIILVLWLVHEEWTHKIRDYI